MSKLRNDLNLLTTAYLASDMTLKEFKDSLLQLFKDTVERIIGEDEVKRLFKRKIRCGCNCTSCNIIIHQCKNPSYHYPLRDDAILGIKNELRKEQRQNLSRILSETEIEKE